MKTHAWKQSPIELFHHFHQALTVAICDQLNAGILPKGYYTLIEQHAVPTETDVIVHGV